MEALTDLRPDLADEPLPDTELELYTDGGSFIRDGERFAGAALTTRTGVLWAQPLGHGTSVQRAELIALTQALQWAKGKSANIYTESKYAFTTAHIHGPYTKKGASSPQEGNKSKIRKKS